MHEDLIRKLVADVDDIVIKLIQEELPLWCSELRKFQVLDIVEYYAELIGRDCEIRIGVIFCCIIEGYLVADPKGSKWTWIEYDEESSKLGRKMGCFTIEECLLSSNTYLRKLGQFLYDRTTFATQ